METAWFKGEIKRRTDKAFFVLYEDADEPEWIPKLLILNATIDAEDDDNVEIELPRWKAEQLGWV